MFDQITILKLGKHLETVILKFQIYCVSHDTHKLGYKSITPLLTLDDEGYEEQLARNKDLMEEINRCQIQLQALLEVVEKDKDLIVEKLKPVKPPAKPSPTKSADYDDTQEV